MEIREINETDDLKAVGDIYALSWQTAYQGILPQIYLDELKGNNWVEMLSKKKYTSIVILDGDKYVGVSAIGAARDEKMPGWGEIISIYLLPEYYGKGYGGPLFKYAVDSLESRGFKNIYLWVVEENIRAQKFYEKHGFQKNGDTLDFTLAGKELLDLRYTINLE